MPRYVDGFLTPLDYVEPAGDDLRIKDRVHSLPKMARRKTGETVLFSSITCRLGDTLVAFDRMAYGGFSSIKDR